ncbi:hypothetical protein B0A48_16681 [Cryoendolithus antarcticus]|uniref:Uncharacterized protein n=1 Tax=Cryoendolithus antarcticus TaxID=1507870 RepID=A0A1V8SEE4_9PEZI|nr:hypothetical protein B0A48_16681 [Cryoendolithus antarcticus]
MSSRPGFPHGGLPDQGWKLYITSVVMIVTAGLFTLGRCVLRLHTRQFGRDDIVIVVSLLFSILLSVTIQLAVEHGYGMHKVDLTKPELPAALRWFFIAQTPYKVVTCLNKISAILLYQRIFISRRFQIAAWICLGIVVSWSLGSIAATILQCIPIAGSWDKSVHAKCIDSNAFWMGYSISNILTDVMVLALPIPQVLKLHLDLRERILLCGVFLMAGFVTVASILRATAVHNSLRNQSDSTWGFIPRGIWTLIEADVGIICASLPILKRPIGSLLSRLFGPMSAGQSSDTWYSDGPPVHQTLEVPPRRGPFTQGGMQPVRNHRQGDWQSAARDSDVELLHTKGMDSGPYLGGVLRKDSWTVTTEQAGVLDPDGRCHAGQSDCFNRIAMVLRRTPTAVGDGASPSLSHGQVMPVPNPTTPYWRIELHPIDEHRSTEQLPKQCDIAIIGAGLSGVATAYHLIKKAGSNPPSVVLLEARQVCSGATGRNGGHCKAKTTTLLGVARDKGVGVANELAAFVDQQIQALKHLVEEEDLDCEFELRRSYDVFLDPVEAATVRKEFQAAVREGQEWTRTRSLIECKHLEQMASMSGAQLAISCSICSFWPYKLVTQLLAKLVESGAVNLQTSTPVIGVGQVIDGSNVVETNRGQLRASKVIFATNAYTSGICPTFTDRIVPTNSTAVHITPENGPVHPHLSQTYNIGYQADRVDYLNPRPDGGIVVGGGQWTYRDDRKRWYNDWDDSKLLPEVMSHFDGLMQRHFLGWDSSGAEIDNMWTGIQGITRDGLPFVGEVVGQQGKQYVLAGYNGGGMAMIFLCAEGVAEMIVNGKPYEDTGLPMMMKSTAGRLRGSL